MVMCVVPSERCVSPFVMGAVRRRMSALAMVAPLTPLQVVLVEFGRKAFASEGLKSNISLIDPIAADHDRMKSRHRHKVVPLLRYLD